MRPLIVFLLLASCFGCSVGSAEPARPHFGVGAGLAYCPDVERNLSRMRPECEGFVAWDRSESNELRIGLHWLRLERYSEVFSSEPESGWFAPTGAAAAAGADVRTEGIEVVDLRATSVWQDHTAGRVRTHAGAGLGFVTVLFADSPSRFGLLFAPTFGAVFTLGQLPLAIETGAELVVGRSQDARFAVVPLRVSVAF
jgi:hypothetical protein